MKNLYKLFLFSFPFLQAFALTDAISMPVLIGAILALTIPVLHFNVRFKWTNIDRAIVLFFLSILVSNLYNINHFSSKQLNHSISWIVCFFCFYLVNRIYLKIVPVETVVKLLKLTYILVVAFCICEFSLRTFASIDVNNYIPRPSGQEYSPAFLGLTWFRSRAFFSESAEAGMYITLTFPFILYWNNKANNRLVEQLLTTFLTVLALFTIFSTTLFIFFPLFWFVIICLPSRRFLKRLIWTLPLFVIIVAVFRAELFLIVDALILSKFQMSSADIRADNMEATLTLIRDSPILNQIFGYGPGSYFRLSLPDAAPSVFVNVYRDLGILGIACYLLIWLSAFIKTIHVSDTSLRKYLFLMLCMIIIYHISNLSYNGPYIWFVLAVVADAKVFQALTVGDK